MHGDPTSMLSGMQRPSASQLSQANERRPTGLPPPSPKFRPYRPKIDASSFPDFQLPAKVITNQADIETFLESEGLHRFMAFLLAVNDACKNKKCLEVARDSEQSENIQKLVQMLRQLSVWIDQIPPDTSQQQRYGNTAFRDWMQRLEQSAESLLKQLLPPRMYPAIVELREYLITGFGNATRIDYGSGHEMTFLAFLCCLDMIGFTEDQDLAAMGLVVFNEYLLVIRQLQRVYRLEPAGSHGVWGLCDYQFIVYLFGAAQLFDHPNMRPKSFLNREILQAYSQDFMFLAAIRFIHEMKSGPFHEHSPMLYDISGVPNWQKVNKGLIKMYVAEVLKKVPIVQHFEFGGLIPWRPLDLTPLDLAK